jgi:hypothetical protein
MKIVKINRKNENLYIPIPYNYKDGDQYIEYFLLNEGTKKTKRFEIVEADIPELYANISWYDIIKIYIDYGYYIAIKYANNKVAGVVASSFLNSYTGMYLKAKDAIKDISEEDLRFWFDNLIVPDYFLSLIGYPSIDLFALDKNLERYDLDYDSNKALYKNKPISQKSYITLKYGSMYQKMIESMI